LVSTEKVINSNPRRNLREFMVVNVYFATTTQDNFEYMLYENAKLRRELALGKQHAKHLVAENQ